jgi:glycosyltransferase involved in cell wall biosynthesis
MVLVDDRWKGQHGIGRYATEVLLRLSSPWRPLGLEGLPSDALDALTHRGVARSEIVYSPGYNAFLGGGTQLLTVHDLIYLQMPWPGRAKYLAYFNGVVRPVVRRAGVVITDSETSVRAIAAWLRDDRVEIVNASVGCSTEFRPEGDAATSGRPYVVYVGNMRPHKNLDTIFAAFARLADLELFAVLPATDADAARVRIAAHGVEDRVTLIHGIEDRDLARLYRGAVATVMPSTMEGFGLPPLESTRCGTPVIWWQGCDVIAETVGDRGIAVASATDAGEWSAAIQALARSPRRVAPPPVDRFSWDQTAQIVQKTIGRVQ